MKQFTLNSNDLQSCVELAADGVNLHLCDQPTLDIIHKVMYAIAEAAQNSHAVTGQLELNQTFEYRLYLQNISIE